VSDSGREGGEKIKDSWEKEECLDAGRACSWVRGYVSRNESASWCRTKKKKGGAGVLLHGQAKRKKYWNHLAGEKRKKGEKLKRPKRRKKRGGGTWGFRKGRIP